MVMTDRLNNKINHKKHISGVYGRKERLNLIPRTFKNDKPLRTIQLYASGEELDWENCKKQYLTIQNDIPAWIYLINLSGFLIADSDKLVKAMAESNSCDDYIVFQHNGNRNKQFPRILFDKNLKDLPNNNEIGNNLSHPYQVFQKKFNNFNDFKNTCEKYPYQTTGKKNKVKINKTYKPANLIDYIASRNGLSFLLNKGMTLFSSEEETKDIILKKLTDKGIFNKEKHLDIITQNAKKIRENLYFSNYDNFRSIISGSIQSWMTNHKNRLKELEKLFNCDPNKNNLTKQISDLSSVDIPDVLSLKAELPDSRKNHSDRFIDDCKLLISQINRTKEALSHLLNGSNDWQSTVEEAVSQIADFVNFLNEIKSKSNELVNAIIQEKSNTLSQKKNKSDDSLRKDIFEKYQFLKILNEIEQPNKILKIREAQTLDLDKLKNLGKDFNQSYEIMEKYFGELTHYDFQKLYDNDDRDYKNQYILEKFCQDLQKSPDRIKRYFIKKFCSDNICQENDIKNKLYNFKGFYYRSESRHQQSESRHQPMHFKSPSVNFYEYILSLINDLKPTEALDYYEILMLKLAIYIKSLQGLKGPISKNIIFSNLPSEDFIELPPRMLFIKNNEEEFVDIEIAKIAFSLHVSHLKGLGQKIFRKDFFDKVVFSQDEDTKSLLYIPKLDKKWKIPKRIWQNKNEVGTSLRKLGFIPKQEDNFEIDVKDIVEKLKNLGKLSPSDHEMLVQMPHEWGYVLKGSKSNPDNQPLFAWRVDGKDNKVSIYGNDGAFYILKSSSSKLKSHLNKVLISKNELGAPQFIIKKHYKNKVSLNHNQISIEIEPSDCHSYVHFPIYENHLSTSNSQLNDSLCKTEKFIAFDLGEYEIGYAVWAYNFDKNLKHQNKKNEWRCIKSGVKNVKSMQKLINSVKGYRKIGQKQTKYNKAYDPYFENLREEVLGNLRQLIDRLCIQYKAFPVFEFGVQNFETGSKQLQTVYKTIIEYYCPPSKENDAANNRRLSHWNIKNKLMEMEHEKFIIFKKWERDLKLNDISPSKPLILGPGVTVNQAHTSYRCANCKRTASLNIEDDKLYEISDSKVVLADETIIKVTLDNKTIKGKELKKALNIRRKSINNYKHGSSQSRFHCPYIDCYSSKKSEENKWDGVHADRQAAYNIGWKFKETLDTK